MKRLVYLTAVAALLLVVGAGVTAWYVFSFEVGRFRGPVEAELAKLLGREVKLGRISKAAGFLRPHLLVEEFLVLADPVSGDELVRIAQARIGLDLLPLLRRTLSIDSVAMRGVRVSLGTDAAGKPMWPLQIESESSRRDGSVHIEVQDVDLDDADVVYHDGEGGKTFHALIEALELDIHPSGRFDLTARGEIEGMAVQLEGRVEPPPESGGAQGPRKISLEGQLDDVSLRASGTAENVLGLAGLDLALEASAPRLPLPDDWREKLAFEPVEASARVIGAERELRLEAVKIEVGAGAKRLRLTGKIDDLFGDRRGNLAATVDLPNLRALSPIVEFELPNLGPVRGTMDLREVAHELHVEAIDLTAGREGGQRIHVQGRISDLTGLVALDLRARAEAPDLRGLRRGLDPKLAELGPLRVDAQVLGSGSLVHLRRIDAALGRNDDLWASAQGEIHLVGGADHVKLELRAGAPRTRRLEALFGRKLPEVGPVAAAAGIRGTIQRLTLSRGEVRLGPAGRTRLAMKSGSVAIPPQDVFDFDADLRAPNLDTLGKLLDIDLPPKGPVEATATLRVTPEHVALHEIEARIHRTTLTGSAASVMDATGRRHFTLGLASPELHLSDVMPEAGQEDADEGPSFRERRLPVELLRAQDAELVLNSGRVLGRRGLDIEDLRLRLRLEDGRLSIHPFSFQWRVAKRGGPVKVDAGVDASGSEPSWWLRAQADRVDVSSVTAQFTEGEPVKGAGLLIADLESRGRSGQELLEGLAGNLTLALRDAVLHGDYVLLLRRDLIRALALQRVRKDTTSARCFLARFDLRNGVATTQTLLLDSEEVLLHGKGTFDAGQDRFDIVLTPKAKRPGIGLTQPVALRGTLQQPKLRPVKMALARDAAKAALGTLLVPGVGTIAPFLQVGTLGRDPCEQALASYVQAE